MVRESPQPTSSRRRRSRARPRRRRIAERLVLLVVAGLVWRTWYVHGLFVPFQVVSGSMAGALLGVHREVECRDCGYRFACAADVRPIRPRAVCPNCGFPGNDLKSLPDVAGDRLLIEKSVFSFRPPRRWELVAFRHPERPREICIKRVVGLPGESVQIRHGDVYVDAAIQRKTLPQQRAVAVLVHDANHQPPGTTGLPARWRGERIGSGWGSAGGRYAHGSEKAAEPIDWLTYAHWLRVPGTAAPLLETPIANRRGYNQTRPQRTENIHPVTDLMLSFRLARAFGEGRLYVRATDGREQFQVAIDPSGRRYEASSGGPPERSLGTGTIPKWTEALHVEVSLFDRQFLLALDGRPVLIHPYQPVEPETSPTARPFSIGSRGLGVEIRDLRVFRDIYYTHPIGVGGRWGLEEPVRLGPDEYFVLGDNSPISEDSRTWAGGPGIRGQLLLGKPFLVHFPSLRVDLGVWDFQVPDPARIRYIR